ncbi:MAG: hypothetical protein K0S88_3264 [Actinomycetia bacterium]|jgi:hypothetical protein|nr:hypothetical protein [Actinomycetes bacterium]
MSDEELVRLRPRDLAAVWGTAFGQVVDLWRAWLTALMEAGSAEDPALVGDHRVELLVPAPGGRLPDLSARNLVGETFGGRLDPSLVTFADKGPAGPGMVLVECAVDEARGRSIKGDRYHGEVVDERGAVIGRIVLDAGS